MKKFLSLFFIILAGLVFINYNQPADASLFLPYCDQPPDGIGKTPPDCNVGHSVSLTCEVNAVYDAYNIFIGWDIIVNAQTSPAEKTLIQGSWSNGLGAGDSISTHYTDSYNYSRFQSAHISDPVPTINVGASVDVPYHVGDAQCNAIGEKPPGEPPVPTGTISATPNPCLIPSGGLNCTSYITWNTTNVSSARVLVSANNGPESLFKNQLSCSNQSCPSAFITPAPDFYDFRLYDYSSGFKGQLLDSVRVTAERSSPPDQIPTGNIDSAECTLSGGSITGWAVDLDSPGASIKIQIYRDGPKGQGGIFVGEYTTDVLRPDVNTALGISGNHGFNISPIPSQFRDGQLHYVYIYGININSSSPDGLLSGSPKPLQCPEQPVCPSAASFKVVLASSTIKVGNKTLAIAPSGWSGGSFVSSSGAVSLGAVVDGTAEVVGVGVGTANISGLNWTASNGAKGCDLGNAKITVDPASNGFISADPNTLKLCIGETTGQTTITAGTNTYAEVRVYGAEGLPDGQVFFTLLSHETKTVTTGKWVKQGTRFEVVAPLEGGKVLASLTINVQYVSCEPTTPSVDLKAVNPDGSLTDGPVSISVGGSVPLEWISENVDSCIALGGWSSDTGPQGKGNSGPVFSSKTFTVECYGGGGTVRDSVSVNVILPVNGPRVDLKYVYPDGSVTDGPVSVQANTAITLRWTSEYAQNCLSTGGWTQSKAVSGEQSGIVVTKSGDFEMVCFGHGEARDTVRVNIAICPAGQSCGGGGGGGPVSSAVYNTSTASNSGLAVACGQLLSTWTIPNSVVDGFRMYYYSDENNAWERLWDIPYSSAQKIGNGVNERFFYRFSPPAGELTKLFRYRLYTYVGGSEFPPNSDTLGSPIATTWPCEADFDGSNKDIVKIRNISLDYDIRKDQDSNVSPAVPIIVMDKIGFSINVLNSGEVDYSGDIVVDDDMLNLQRPTGGWEAKVDCDNECTLKSTEYNPVARRLTFVLSPRGGQTLAGGGVEIWKITFSAIAKPETGVDNTFRIQNTAYINGLTTPLLKTPKILVLPADAPTIKEIQ